MDAGGLLAVAGCGGGGGGGGEEGVAVLLVAVAEVAVDVVVGTLIVVVVVAVVVSGGGSNKRTFQSTERNSCTQSGSSWPSDCCQRVARMSGSRWKASQARLFLRQSFMVSYDTYISGCIQGERKLEKGDKRCVGKRSHSSVL